MRSFSTSASTHYELMRGRHAPPIFCPLRGRHATPIFCPTPSLPGISKDQGKEPEEVWRGRGAEPGAGQGGRTATLENCAFFRMPWAFMRKSAT